MSNKSNHPNDGSGLRARAEAQVRGKTVSLPGNAGAGSQEDDRRMLHELQVHQIELEMQNEELRQAYEALDAAKARYFNLYDFAPVGYCTVNNRGIILEANLAAASLLGVARGAMAGRLISLFVHKDDQHIFYLRCTSIFETGEPQTCELRIAKKDGTISWAKLDMTATEGVDGKSEYRVILSDCTERRRMDEALKENGERLRKILEDSPDASYKIDLQAGSYGYLSPGFARIFGYFPDEMKNIPAETIRNSIHPDDVDEYRNVIAASIADPADTSYEVEYRFRQGNGKYSWFQDLFAVRRDANGKPLAQIGSIRNITDRKQAEEAVNNAIRFQQDLMDAIPSPIFYKDAKGVYIGSNKAFERYLGLSPEQYIGKTVYDISPADLAKKYDKADRALLENPGVQTYEASVVYGDGIRHDVVFNKATFTDSEGKVAGLIGVILDITERKKAEKSLGREQAFTEAVFESIPGMLYVYDEKGNFIKGNRKHEEMTGYSAEELSHMNPLSWYDDDSDIQRVKAAINDVFTQGYGEVEAPMRIKNGEKPLIYFTGSRLIVDGMAYFVGVGIDITDRRKVSDALKESEQNYRTLADSGRALVWTAGTDKLCNYFNRVWLEFTGRSLEQELGNGWTEGVHPDDMQRCLDIYVGAFDRRESFSMEYRLRHRDGEYRWIIDDGSPRYDAKGTFIGYIGHCLDITDRKKAEDEVRALNATLDMRIHQRTAELLAANKELESFSYSVSHDLRAPLRSIEGFSQLFLDEYGSAIPEKGREYLQRVRRNALRMGQLIDDLLTLSRAASGELSLKKIDMSALATEVARDLAADNPLRDVEVNIEPGMRAMGDPHLLRVVLTNLLGNAWKFTSKREHAHVSMGTVKNPERGPVFFVRDDGAGFNAAYKGKLFSAFQRLHTEKEFPGTGIGLAIVARIVHHHDGEVWAEGEVNKGAIFYFSIPDPHTANPEKWSGAKKH